METAAGNGKAERRAGRSRGRIVALLAIWLGLSAAAAAVLAHEQRDNRAEVETRFRLRADVTSKFVETYVQDFFAQERRVAERLVAGQNAGKQAFERTVTLLGAEAAVLLDGDGRLLQVAPSDPTLLGKDLAAEYEHLGKAVEGRAAASSIVPSAAEGVPIIAFAVPFAAAGERRVFSGAFDIRSSPLADYLRRAAALAPNRAYLIDRSGSVFATSDDEIKAGDPLPLNTENLKPQESPIQAGFDRHEYVVSAPVAGTPWTLVMVSPESTLYSTIGGFGRLLPWLLWLGFVGVGLVSVLLVERLVRRRAQLAELNRRLELIAHQDLLTGLVNRRGIELELDRWITSCRRYGHPLAVLLIDVDNFKAVNDSLGHRAGDAMLNAVAERVTATLREVDIAGRWGGDELLVLLPHIGAEEAAQAAARLNGAVRDLPLVIDEKLISPSISVGCAGWNGESAEALVHRADEALYAAKRGGRDQFAISAG